MPCVYTYKGREYSEPEFRGMLAGMTPAEAAPFMPGDDGVPDMPFKATEEWAMLVARHVIDKAVKGGYARIAWTPGEIQGDRYDLSKVADEVLYNPKTSRLVVMNEGEQIHSGDYDPRALGDVIGKDAAERLLARPLEPSPWLSGDPFQVLAGENLKIPATGMIAFYDKMLPKALKSYAKKAGVEISFDEISVTKGGKAYVASKNSEWGTPGDELTDDDLTYAGAGLGAAGRGDVIDILNRVQEKMRRGATFTEAVESQRMSEISLLEEALDLEVGEVPGKAIPSFAISPSLKNLVNTKGQFLMDEPGALQPPTAEEHKKNNTLVGQALLRKDAAKVAFGSEKKMDFVELAVKRVKKRIAAAMLPSVRTRAKEVKAHESLPLVNLTGWVLSDAKDAALAMSTQRSPVMEHLSVMHIKAGPSGTEGIGEVALHTRNTSGALNFARLDTAELDQIIADAKRVGTKAVLLGHNHPSGLAQASKADIQVTIAAAEYLAAHGIALMGQVVIDHDEFAWINHDGSVINRIGFAREGAPKYMTAVAAGRPSIPSADAAAALIKSVSDKDAMTVLLLDTQFAVIAATARPPGDAETVGEWLKDLMESVGAQKVMLGLPTAAAKRFVPFVENTRAWRSADAARYGTSGEADWTDDVLDVFHVTPQGDAVSLTEAGVFRPSGGNARSFDLGKEKNRPTRVIGESRVAERAIVRAVTP